MSKNKNRKISPKNKIQKVQPSYASMRPTVEKPALGLWLFGKHAVVAALQNPMRKIKRLIVTKKSQDQYQKILTEIHLKHRALNPEIVSIEIFEKHLPSDAVHQGIALQTEPLPNCHIEDCCTLVEDKNLLIILDQVTDPHNVGAIIRSAAAFGAKAIITTDRHAPPESGTLAKSASGALEVLPWVRVTNLGRALDQLADIGYWRIGLDGYATKNIDEVDLGQNIALIMGAEGKGMRKGTTDHCDALVKLPISGDVESLNVSNAAAVALYVFAS